LILIVDGVMLTNSHLEWKRRVHRILEERFGVKALKNNPHAPLVVRRRESAEFEGAVVATFEEDWEIGTFTLTETRADGTTGMKLVLDCARGFTFIDAEERTVSSLDITRAREWLQEFISHINERLRS
jgi:hypothetical protein